MDKKHKTIEIKGNQYDAATKAPTVRHAPQPTHTLMRGVVHKPSASPKRHLRAVGADSTNLAKAPHALVVKPSVHHLDTSRLQHAKQVKKSVLVSRFGKLEPTWPAATVTPAATPTHPVRRIVPATPAAKHPQTTAEFLQHALELANGHEQPPVKPHSRSLARRIVSRRITGVSALVIASCLLVGLVVSSNSTAFRLHTASREAGFTASLPAHQPSGYRLSHLNYRPGTVAMEFNSNSANRTYAITEQISEWDSQTLRDDFLTGARQDYQIVESAGRTLYLYGQNDATWVNSGVWYQIKSDGALSAQQLVELAGSM